jgi:hypothetical protein
MASRKTLFVVCLVASVLCLAAGYAIAGQWVGAVVALITGLAWLLARKYLASWLPLICLLASIGLAVVGLLIGSPALLMICGSSVALVVWDLLLLDAALENNPPREQTRRYENKHLQSLALALGSGLLAAFLGRLLSLQIPFVVLILFVALTIFGLDRVWGYIKKAGYR